MECIFFYAPWVLYLPQNTVEDSKKNSFFYSDSSYVDYTQNFAYFVNSHKAYF